MNQVSKIRPPQYWPMPDYSVSKMTDEQLRICAALCSKNIFREYKPGDPERLRLINAWRTVRAEYQREMNRRAAA